MLSKWMELMFLSHNNASNNSIFRINGNNNYQFYSSNLIPEKTKWNKKTKQNKKENNIHCLNIFQNLSLTHSKQHQICSLSTWQKLEMFVLILKSKQNGIEIGNKSKITLSDSVSKLCFYKSPKMLMKDIWQFLY